MPEVRAPDPEGPSPFRYAVRLLLVNGVMSVVLVPIGLMVLKGGGLVALLVFGALLAVINVGLLFSAIDDFVDDKLEHRQSNSSDSTAS